MSIKNNSVNNKADLIEICAEYCRENQMQPATVAGYFRILRIFIRDTGVTTVSGITPECIVAWRDSVISRCTATTFNTYRRHVRAILNHCVRKKYLAENPILLIRQCRNAIVRRKACSREDVERLCQHLQADLGDPVSIFLLRGVATLYYTGIRLSQLAGLEWNDIDFDANTILLREKYSKTGVEWSIPLHEDLHGILLQMQDEARRVFPGFRKTDQVFLLQRYSDRYQGDRMKSDQFARILKKTSMRAGVTVSSHRIRHLFATMLANQESEKAGSGDTPLTLVALKEILGHRNIATTVSYIEPRLASQRRVLGGIKSLTGVNDPVSSRWSGTSG